MFDAGLSSNKSGEYIFITHGHSDHTASLYFHTLSENHQTIYCPFEIEQSIKALLATTFRVCNYNIQYDQTEVKYTVVGVKAGDILEIKHNGINHRVHVYDNHHSVPCRSFGVQEQKKILKTEYRTYIDSRKKELGDLRRAGIQIEEYVYIPRFVYVGDTTEDVFANNPELFEYKDIIIECTFIEDDDIERAAEKKHCHWSLLRQIIRNHPNNNFILYHFSTRYTVNDIETFFRKDGANYEPNIHIWTNS
jgi:ribonuclease Z